MNLLDSPNWLGVGASPGTLLAFQAAKKLGTEDVSRWAVMWTDLGVGGRLGVIASVVLLLGYGVYRGLRRLGKAGRHTLLVAFTSLSFAGLLGLGYWSKILPAPQGTYFVLWHQVVRVGAAASATVLVLGSMALLLPRILNLVERWGFVGFVAGRHVRASKSGFLTVISLLSISGVGVSAFALCAVVSIMGGFGADLKRKILGNSAHITIDTPEVLGFLDWEDLLIKLRARPEVFAATPVVGGEAMASSHSNTAGVLVRGIETTSIGSVIELVSNIEVGKFEYLTDPIKLTQLKEDDVIGLGPDGERYLKGPSSKRWFGHDPIDDAVSAAMMPEDVLPGVVLGRELAKSLHVYVGDDVKLVSPLGELSPIGVLPRTSRYRVAGIFYSGMYEYDASHAYMLLDEAQKFLDMEGYVSKIDVKIVSDADLEEARVGLSAAVAKPLRVRDWKELNKSLFAALKLEKIVTFLILSVAIAVASFCIICTLLLMVTEKSKEIAVLKSLGASNRNVLEIFMVEGTMIGAIGTFFGVITALVLCKGLEQFGVRLDPEVYYVDRLPIEVNKWDYAMVAVAALGITVLATVYPALAASRLRPVDGIRHE